LTAIRLAEAQLAVPFGEAPPTNPVTSLQPTPAAQVTPYHPEPPTVSAGEPVRIRQFELTDPLERAYAALRTMVTYVDNDLYILSQGLTRPLHELINALSDTLKGGRHTLLQPRRLGKGAPKNQSFSSVQGVLGAALDALMRAGIPRNSAARFIASHAESLKIRDRNGHRLTPKEIVAWRARAGDDMAATVSGVLRPPCVEWVSCADGSAWTANRRRSSGMFR
jgi:hypothetical protein